MVSVLGLAAGTWYLGFRIAECCVGSWDVGSEPPGGMVTMILAESGLMASVWGSCGRKAGGGPSAVWGDWAVPRSKAAQTAIWHCTQGMEQRVLRLFGEVAGS